MFRGARNATNARFTYILVLRVMPSTISRSHESVQRREKFRDYMRKLNPTAPARTTIDSGLVIEDIHASLFRTLAARADLDPGSQQLLVGGTGSGKTTELLMAEKWLREQGQTLPLYIDVSGETDLSALNSGALLATFGLHLSRAFFDRFADSFAEGEETSMKTAQCKLHEFAFGKTEVYKHSNLDPFVGQVPGRLPPFPALHSFARQVPGKLTPFPVLPRDIQEIAGMLKKFVGAFQSRSLDVVVIFDGLDRLIFPEKFWAVVDQDFRALRRMSVAVLAAAPLSILYGEGRSVSEHFDRIHQVHALNSESTSSSSLKAVLARRGGTELLRDEEAELVCSSSGGVLRDLITLARDAGETAYIEGSPWIYAEHVSSAVAQLGNSYLRGLSPAHLEILRRLAKERVFNPASSDGVELLVTGRVIEYSATDFRVHPALSVLLAESGLHG